jgi:hypothetical protein
MNESTLRSVARYSLTLSLLVFVIFFCSVLLTGPLGFKPFLTDLQEMTMLFVCVIFFVSGILAKEALANLPD